MKKLIAVLGLIIIAGLMVQAEIKVVSVKGDISVRHGTQEQWRALTAGDILKPEDSMKSGDSSSAVLMVDGKTKLILPPMVIIDCSDIRILTQEELLLKLAMEGIRSVPTQNRDNGLTLPKTTTVHGTHTEEGKTLQPLNKEEYVLLLNGTRVLYKHGFYATMVLRAKDVFRFDPDQHKRIDIRLMMANAFEKMKLNGEALSEYVSLSKEQMSAKERLIVKEKITQLKKKQEG